MKKLFTGILTMVYMTVSSGIAIEIHYCMGKKAGFELYGSANEQCGKCGMKENKTGCCHDEHKFVKLQDSHKNVVNDLSFETKQAIVVTSYALYNWQAMADVAHTAVNNNSPPDYTGPSVCVLNCVFRI